MKEAWVMVQEHAVYQHYKGNCYRILHLAWLSGDGELAQYVVYQALYDDPRLGKKPIFVQPVARFLQKIMVDGQQVARFELISEDENLVL